MIEAFDDQVRDWIVSVAEGKQVSLAAPASQRSGSGVGAYLVDLMKAAPVNTIKRPIPLQITLRYLVTVWSDKPEDAHQLLVRLMFAAMESNNYQVEPEAVPVSLWTAMGLPPQPSFFLRVPVVYDRSGAPPKLVRQPVKIQTSSVISLHGLVLGPGNTPLADCRVEIPALRLSTSTDYKGRFCFNGVPGEGKNQLVVSAKGRELPVTFDRTYPDSAAPLVINFSPLEA